jgi:DNA-binding LacI/PurR family transcriptional regulator
MSRSAPLKPTLKARGTLRDVAHLVGVSHTTVSNAFSRPDQLSPEWREKILAAARSVHYPGPNPAARMLMSGFANTIALPMVVVDPPLLPKVPFIGIDDRAAARVCARHLKELGHQNVAIVTFKLGSDGHDGLIDRERLQGICFEIPRRRIEGYLQGLGAGERGSAVMIWECSRSNEESGRIAAEAIFASKPRPTAILATSDRLAIGVIEAAEDHQLRVPQDLAVVGFDDIPAANFITPRLTTVRQPMAEKGRSAVSRLLKENAQLRLKLPAELIVRESTVTTQEGRSSG